MTALVRLRSLPGIDGIEAALVLAYADREEDHALNARIRQLIGTTFGIASGDLAPRYPWWVESVPVEEWGPEREKHVARLMRQWEAHFDDLDDADAEAWAALGWDVLDAQGQVMRCVADFGMAMVACAKGLCGRSMAELGALGWASKLEGGARPVPDAKRAECNRKFLELGDRRSHRRAAK